MRKFVDQDQLRAPCQRSIQIKFAQLDSTILHQIARDGRQPFRQRIRFLAPVRFEITDDHLASGGGFSARRLQHGVGLPDAGTHAEKDFEFAATLLGLSPLERGEQRIGVGSGLVRHAVI
jgi:hypothetical protein